MIERTIYLTSPLKREGAIHLPMIKFSTIADDLGLEGYDTLMFTSKQAVAVADAIDRRWREYPSIAIGSATAGEIQKRGGSVIYTPSNFYGQTLARDIAEFFAERRVLYLRPEKVSFDSKAFLSEKGIELGERIVYRTECLNYGTNDAPAKGSVIVFTSPSTIHCFLKNFSWDDSYTAVVIGRATLEHLPPNTRSVVAAKPLIDSCLAAARELRNNLSDTK